MAKLPARLTCLLDLPMIGKHEVHGTSRTIGRPCLVVKVDEQVVTFITYDLSKLFTGELPHAEFFREYRPYPFFDCGPRIATTMFNMKNVMGADEQTVERLRKLMGKQTFTLQELNGDNFPLREVEVAAMKSPYVAADYQRRTCLVVAQTDSGVSFIPMSSDGLELVELSTEAFAKQYQPLPDYPVEKAAALYVNFAIYSGATRQAMMALSKLTTVTDQEIQMSVMKKSAAKTPTDKAGATAAAKVNGTAPATKEAKATKAAAPKTEKVKAPKEAKEKAPRPPSAASRFKELILEGKLSDNKIFAQVQKEFKLEDDKRSYVSWYRNYLTKQGVKVPPVVAEKD